MTEFNFFKIEELEGSELTEFSDIHGDGSEWLTLWTYPDGSTKELHWMGEQAATAFCIVQAGESVLSLVRGLNTDEELS